jgi:uncharacterized ion transporter superfamily protein YfcC
MKRKLLIGILIVLGIAVTVLNPLVSGICAVGVWIYLVRMVRKQKYSSLNDQMEQEVTERHLKRLKVLLVVAGFSFLVFVFGSIAHNALPGLYEIEESASFFVAIGALLVFIGATAGGMVLFLRARNKRS